jgi:hypothetical protein
MVQYLSGKYKALNSNTRKAKSPQFKPQYHNFKKMEEELSVSFVEALEEIMLKMAM